MKMWKLVFWGIGIAVLAIAGNLYMNTQNFIAKAQKAEGVVVKNIRSRSDDSYTYSPAVKFQTRDGRTVKFVSKLGSGTPTYSVGEQVEVLYDEDKPEAAKINSFLSLYFGSMILGIIGGMFCFIMVSTHLFKGLGKKKEAYLLQQGRPIQAKVQGVEKNTSLEMNGRNPYRIIAHWHNASSNEVHVFKSKNIWFNPEDYIDREEVTVYLDKSNAKKYHMDISFLPKVVD